jgi:hypothetical protein
MDAPSRRAFGRAIPEPGKFKCPGEVGVGRISSRTWVYFVAVVAGLPRQNGT